MRESEDPDEESVVVGVPRAKGGQIFLGPSQSPKRGQFSQPAEPPSRMTLFSEARHWPILPDVDVDAFQRSESPVRPRRPRISSSPYQIGDVDTMSDQLAPAPRTNREAAIQQKTLLYDTAQDVYIARDIRLVEADIKAAGAENAGMHHGEAARLVADQMKTVERLLNLEKLRTSASDSARVTKTLEKATFDEMDLDMLFPRV